MTKYVYQLYYENPYGNYHDEELDFVFSTEEAAKKYCEEYRLQKIEECRLKKFDDLRKVHEALLFRQKQQLEHNTLVDAGLREDKVGVEEVQDFTLTLDDIEMTDRDIKHIDKCLYWKIEVRN